MEHKGTLRLETQRLILRPFVRDDCRAIYENWASDKRVTEFLRWEAHDDISVTEKVLGYWINGYKDPAFYQWAIVLKSLGEPIGTIAVVDVDEKTDRVQIGYCVGANWWRQGLASEAFQGIIPFLFDEVNVRRIEAQHDPNNPGSGKVMLKCALKYEGTMRKADWNNRGIVDASMYALLAEDYYADK